MISVIAEDGPGRGMGDHENTTERGEDRQMKKHYPVLFVIVILPMLFIVSTEAAGQSHAVRKDESLRRGETRATLDPNLFKDPQVRKAYQVAKEIPWVLDSIYCYCFCEESFQHKSVLSCYVDQHAAV